MRHEIFGNHTCVISEFKVCDNPNIADAGSERVLMTVNQPQFNHNGGALEFGRDGYLYIALGDGGFADDWGYGHNKKIGNAQDLSNLLGKVLRIDVDKKDEDLGYLFPSLPRLMLAPMTGSRPPRKIELPSNSSRWSKGAEFNQSSSLICPLLPKTASAFA